MTSRLDARVRAIALGVQVLGELVHAHGPLLPAGLIDGWLAWRATWERFRRAPTPPAALELDAFERQLHGWRGMVERVARERGAAVGVDWLPYFVSPSRSRARMDSVNAEVSTLDEHIRGQREALGEAFVHAWERWRDSWRTFYGGYDRDWDWWYLGNASAWNETLAFQERLGHWREAAERAGARFTVPRPQTAPETRPSSWLGGARDIAIAGAIGAVAIGAVYLVSKVA